MTPEEKALRAIANLAAQRDQIGDADGLRLLLVCISQEVQRSGLEIQTDAM
jgi:hypothetical protein